MNLFLIGNVHIQRIGDLLGPAAAVKDFFREYSEAELPVVESGKAVLFDGGYVLDDRLTMRPAPLSSAQFRKVGIKSAGAGPDMRSK